MGMSFTAVISDENSDEDYWMILLEFSTTGEDRRIGGFEVRKGRTIHNTKYGDQRKLWWVVDGEAVQSVIVDYVEDRREKA